MKSEDSARLRSRLAKTVDQAPIVIRGMASIHCGQYFIRTRLDGQMQKRHQAVDIPMRPNQFIIHIARMAGRISNSIKAVDFCYCTNKPPETSHVHQGPHRDKRSHFGRVTLFRGCPPPPNDALPPKPPRQVGIVRCRACKNDAEGAKTIASFLDRQKRRHALRRGFLGQVVEFVLCRKIDVDQWPAVLLQRLCYKFRNRWYVCVQGQYRHRAHG